MIKKFKSFINENLNFLSKRYVYGNSWQANKGGVKYTIYQEAEDIFYIDIRKTTDMVYIYSVQDLIFNTLDEAINFCETVNLSDLDYISFPKKQKYEYFKKY